MKVNTVAFYWFSILEIVPKYNLDIFNHFSRYNVLQYLYIFQKASFLGLRAAVPTQLSSIV